jgi:GNAT superfamily N-acetyltransferase
VTERLRKLGTLLREGRLDRLIHHLIERVPRWLFHVDILYVTELTEPDRTIRRPRRGVVRDVRPEDAEALEAVFPRGGAAAYRERMSRGDLGFVCEADGRMVAMGWLNPGAEHAEPEKFCHFVVPPDAVWAYDLWVLPEWRLRGAMVAVVLHTFDCARRLGRSRLCGYASWHNRESLGAHVSFGHRLAGRLVVVNLLGLRWHRARRLEPGARAWTRFGFRSTPRIDLLSSAPSTRG